MIRVDGNKVPFYQFAGFREFPELTHFVSGREGGVSKGGRAALNVGFMEEDEIEAVLINRGRLAEAVGVDVESFTLGEQKHTVHIKVVEALDRGKGGQEKETRFPETDALITRVPGICLMVLAADCVPVLLYDPEQRVIAAIHAGWRGTVGQIAARTVERMHEVFGSDPGNILAGIGPSIGPCCFEVGEEVIAAAEEGFGDLNGLVEKGEHPGKYLLNLWEANRRQLEWAGLAYSRIEVAEICTLCHHDKFFSYRGDRGDTGRFGAGIRINIKD